MLKSTLPVADAASAFTNLWRRRGASHDQLIADFTATATSRCTLCRVLRISPRLLARIGHPSPLSERILRSNTATDTRLLSYDYKRSAVQIRTKALVQSFPLGRAAVPVPSLRLGHDWLDER